MRPAALSLSMLKRARSLSPARAVRALRALWRLDAIEASLRAEQKKMARQLKVLTRSVDELRKAIQQQQALTAELPALRSTLQRSERMLEQCVGVYTRDAMHAARMPRVRERLDAARVDCHAVAAVQRAPLQMDPGAHVVIEDLLPEDVADDLVKAVPPSLFFPNHNMKRQELGVPFFFAPEYSRVVWGFFAQVLERAILPALVEKFRPALDEFVRANWPALDSFAASGIRLDVINSRLMLRRPGYRIRPHRDPRWAFLTCLVYLQKRDDPHAYGTQFYRLRQERTPTHHSALWIDEGEVELVKEVPAKRNSAVVFLNFKGAHGAFIPPDAPPETERVIFQAQFGPDEATRQRLVEQLDEPSRLAWTTGRGGGY